MAKRRMLSIDFCESDRFYELSSLSQALYFHLNLNADDDGLVDNVKSVMRDLKATKRNYQTLVDEGYIIELSHKVVAITNWHQHNRIKSDRYIPTDYVDLMKLLERDEKGRYFKASQGVFGDICAPQDSIGKDSIDKDSIVKVSTDKESIAEVREEKDKNNTLSLSYIQSSTHTESASQNTQQEDVYSVNSDLMHKTDSNLVSIALRNAIALYCMKKYQTIDIADFLQYCNSRNWVSDDGESMMDNYIKYVDLWMSKK